MYSPRCTARPVLLVVDQSWRQSNFCVGFGVIPCKALLGYPKNQPHVVKWLALFLTISYSLLSLYNFVSLNSSKSTI
jgi:hypothetical protein